MNEYKCEWCNNRFKRWKYRVLSRKHIFCSNKCQGEFYLKDKKIIDIDKKDNRFYYFLGLIATDGSVASCVKTNNKYYGYRCILQLHEKDKELIYQIKKIFGGTIRRYKKYKAIRWATYTKNFVQYLYSIGFKDNKSLDLNVNGFFNNLSFKEQINFIMGCFDGDGCISISKERRDAQFFICSASKHFATMIYQFFIKNGFNVRLVKTNYGKNPFYKVITNSKYEIIKIMNLMYENCELYMKRKFKKYREIFDIYENNRIIYTT